MYECCTDPGTGEKYGWGRVLNYIGVEWEDKYIDWEKAQLSLFDEDEENQGRTAEAETT